MQFDTRSLWIYLHFPHLHLDVLEQQIEHPQDRHIPRAIYHAKSNSLVQVNQAALALGIKVGMGLASASLMSEGLQIHEYSLASEEKALTQLAHQLYLVTSDVAIDSPNGLYIRAQNMLNLYGGLQAYWQVIRQVLAQNHYQLNFASAYSVNVAKLLALHQFNRILDDKQAIHRHVLKCQLNKTDIDIKDQEKLARVGIKNVESLFTHPLSSLASRVSRFSINVISELRGASPAKLSFYYPPESYQDYIELLYDVQLVDKLLPIIEKLLKPLEQYLLVRNALTLSLNISLYQREDPHLDQVINSALPIYKRQDWMAIITLQFEQLKLKSAVYGIRIHCPKLEHADISDADFFTQKGTHVASLTLLSRLRAKLGDRKVRLLKYSPDFRPEKASTSISQSFSVARKNTDIIYSDRPGFLLSPPEVLSEKVTILNGPERIVSGWWDSDAIQRDYFVAQNTQGQHLWVYKTLQDKWYVHGYFI